MKIKQSRLNEIIKEEVEKFCHSDLLKEISNQTNTMLTQLKAKMGSDKLLEALSTELPDSMLQDALRRIGLKG